MVCSLRASVAAISLLVQPRQTSSMISLSLSVTPSPLGGAGGAEGVWRKKSLQRGVVDPYLSVGHDLQRLVKKGNSRIEGKHPMHPI